MKNIRVSLLALSALALVGVCCSQVVSQEKKPAAAGAGAQPAMTPEQQKEMEMWMKLAEPGAPHKALEAMVGKFDAQVVATMDPGQPPMTSTGTATNEMIMGGRFLQQKFSGTFAGMPFDGIGYTGYDNLKKKYIGTWMDSMSTMVMVSEGSADPAGKVMSLTGTMPDPATGKDVTCRQVVTVVSNDKHTYEMYAPGKDGKEMKCMSITYTRAK